MEPISIAAIIGAIAAGAVSVLALIRTSKCFCCKVETRESLLPSGDDRTPPELYKPHNSVYPTSPDTPPTASGFCVTPSKHNSI